MTRKDFELIAASLNASLNRARQAEADTQALVFAIDDMVTALAMTNPAFNKARFLEAATKA